jgi:hypothetical protein
MNFQTTTATTNVEVDEFGRDLSLKCNTVFKQVFEDIFGRFKGMSWAEIDYLVEEEDEQEEQQRQIVKNEALKTMTVERRALLLRGQYELEEGEEL